MKDLLKSVLFSLVVCFLIGVSLKYLPNKSLDQAGEKLLTSGETVIKSSVASYTNALSITTEDWAGWDDTYNFVLNLNKNYIDENLTDTTLESIKGDMFVFFDAKGDMVYKKVLNSNSNSNQTIIPAEMYKNNKQDNHIYRQVLEVVNKNKGTSQMVHTEKGLLIYSVYPVLPSDRSGSPAGALLIGKFFGEQQESEIIKSSGLDFKSIVFSKAKPDIQDKLLKTGGYSEFEDNTMQRHFLIKDSFDQPALYVIFTYPRVIKDWFEGFSVYLYLSAGIISGLVYFISLKLKYIYFEFIKK